MLIVRSCFQWLDDVIEDDTEPDKKLETTKLDEFKFVNLPPMQAGMSMQELLGIVACMSGLAPQMVINGESAHRVDPCRDHLLLFPTEWGKFAHLHAGN